MITNIDITDTLIAITCGSCGVPFGLANSFITVRKEDHATWYCPNGHPRCYPGKNRAEQLEEQLSAARSLATAERERRQTVERSRNAIKGQVTKIKRRVGNGVCPCCNRSFADLGRHMAGQHPHYAEPDGGQ